MRSSSPAHSVPPQDPAATPDWNDPGDDVQRNFRYQHAYGAILLIAGASGRREIVAVWCEHHEDLLGERADGLYDAYQVKTRREEDGYWLLTDEPLRKSLKRFTLLVQQFDEHIHSTVFVTNTGVRNGPVNSKNDSGKRRDPWSLLHAVCTSADHTALEEPFATAFQELVGYCGCTPEVLFSTLRRTRIVKGPPRDGFDDEVAHTHLPQVQECSGMPPAMLNAVRDEIVQRVHLASSRRVDDPSRRWRPQDGSAGVPAEVLAKRLAVSVVIDGVQSARGVPFRFLPGSADLQVRGQVTGLDVLRAKLTQGGLASQIPMMERRTLSTERRLVEINYASPEKGQRVLDQLVGVVEGECAEATLGAQMSAAAGETYGPRMLSDVYDRLRRIAKEDADMVCHERYECLVGVAGLLTEECRVWWSEHFDLGADR